MASIPLKLNGAETPSSNNYPDASKIYTLKEMSSNNISDGIIYKMLKEFAKVNTSAPKTGDLTTLDTLGNASTTLIGDYVDTNRNSPVGTRGAISSLTYSETTSSIYQVLTTVTGSIVRPICYRDGNLQEMNDTEIFDSIITPALDAMTNRGIGSYHFSAGAPVDPGTGSPLSGTWSSVLTLQDNYRSGNISNTSVTASINNNVQPPTASLQSYTLPATNVNNTTTYTLWRKISDTAPTSQPRPLKFVNSAELGKHVVEMTDADILTLLTPFRNAIVNVGKGRYKFQASLPSGGTWARRGDAVVDLLNVIGEGSYTWGYAQTYTGVYTGYYTSVYAGFYTKPARAGTPRVVTFRDRWYQPNSTASFTPYYTGVIEKYFGRGEASAVARNYVKMITQQYTAPAVSATTLVQNTDYLWVKREN